jgi:hypothetical protein
MENRMTRRGFLGASSALAAGLALFACATTSVYRTVVRSGRIVVDVQDFPDLADAGGPSY